MSDIFAIRSNDGTIHIGQCTTSDEKRSLYLNEFLPSNSRMRIIESKHGNIYVAVESPFVRVQVLLSIIPELLKDVKLTRTFLERDLIPAWGNTQRDILKERTTVSNNFGTAILVQNGHIFTISNKGGVFEADSVFASDSLIYANVQAIYDKYGGDINRERTLEVLKTIHDLGFTYEPVFYMNDKDGKIEMIRLGGDR